jgi:RNA polymerase sigma-70 factor (ECF subfamily)
MSLLDPNPSTRMSLVVRIRNPRDDRAWSEFVAVYEPVIFKMAKRRGIQDADAREIVQEVLMSVAAAIDRFDTESTGSFRGWLSRITRNATIDRLRSATAKHERVDASGARQRLEELAIADSLEKLSPEAEFEQDRRQQLFRWAAAEVRQRTGEKNWIAFWKTAVEGGTIANIAIELDISEGAVYVARCRILKRIRQLVRDRETE